MKAKATLLDRLAASNPYTAISAYGATTYLLDGCLMATQANIDKIKEGAK